MGTVYEVRHLACVDRGPNLLWTAGFDDRDRPVLKSVLRPGRKQLDYELLDAELYKLEMTAASGGRPSKAEEIRKLRGDVSARTPGALDSARRLRDAAAAGELERQIPGATHALIAPPERAREVIRRPGVVPPTRCPTCHAIPRMAYKSLAARINNARGRGRTQVYI
jgi:hypothetical protein